MRTQMMGLALTATALTVLAGCSSTGAGQNTADAGGASADSGLGSPSKTPGKTPSAAATTTATTTSAPSPKKTTTTTETKKVTTAPGPEIASFSVAQKPRCAEGTDKYQNPAVPLIIKWKIKHATSGALSVDDPTHTPGTYGPVGLSGSQDFGFSCAGAVGSTETHTYTIYSVGGGTQRSRTLTVTTEVLDKGTTVS